MPALKRDEQAGAYGGRAFLVPVLWIVALVAVYAVLTDWQAVPNLIAATVAAMR